MVDIEHFERGMYSFVNAIAMRFFKSPHLSLLSPLSFSIFFFFSFFLALHFTFPSIARCSLHFSSLLSPFFPSPLSLSAATSYHWIQRESLPIRGTLPPRLPSRSARSPSLDNLTQPNALSF